MSDETRQLLEERRAALRVAMHRAMHAASEPFRLEIAAIDRAIAALNSVDDVDTVSRSFTWEITPSLFEQRQSVTAGTGKTIKEMALEVLHGIPSGLEAIQILEEIRRRWNVPLERTSLSPQLSRLRWERKIDRIGRRWAITPSDRSEVSDEDVE